MRCLSSYKHLKCLKMHLFNGQKVPYVPSKYFLKRSIFDPSSNKAPNGPQRSTTVRNGLTRPKNGPFMTIYSPWKSPKHRLGLKLPIHLVSVIPCTAFRPEVPSESPEVNLYRKSVQIFRRVLIVC